LAENNKEEFTYAYYQEFVKRLSRNYRFITFPEGRDIMSNPEPPLHPDRPLAIMRHDIDMDLYSALNMSLLEKALGLSATYFFMVTCPIYNVFSPTGSAQVRQILSVGHHLGLHYDLPACGDISLESLNAAIARECTLLEDFFLRPVEAVSFHRWGSWHLSDIILDNRPHTYEKLFLEKFQYFSDSRSRWARGNPVKSEAFLKKANLHLLVHPIWWGDDVMTPFERLTNLVDKVTSRAEQYLAENCDVWNKGAKQMYV
jgi:hypothetical protein